MQLPSSPPPKQNFLRACDSRCRVGPRKLRLKKRAKVRGERERKREKERERERMRESARERARERWRESEIHTHRSRETEAENDGHTYVEGYIRRITRMDLTCLIPQLMVTSMGTGQAQMVQA